MMVFTCLSYFAVFWTFSPSAAASVKHEPIVPTRQQTFANDRLFWHSVMWEPRREAKLLPSGVRIWLLAGRGLPASTSAPHGGGTNDWHLRKSKLEPSDASSMDAKEAESSRWRRRWFLPAPSGVWTLRPLLGEKRTPACAEG